MSERQQRETKHQSKGESGVTDQGNGAERICRISASPLQGRRREQRVTRQAQSGKDDAGSFARDGWRGRGSGVASEGDVGKDWRSL